MAENYSVIYGWTGKSFVSPSGFDEKPEFGYVKEVDKETGKEEIVFKQVGSSSISEYINSFNDTTDIKEIFKRYQMGDVSVLSKRVGDFIDTVGCPESLVDAQLVLKNGQATFDTLPSEIREQFDNDPLKFVQACLDGSISKVITGLSEQHKSDQDLKDSYHRVQTIQNEEIEKLKAQIEELKGVKYE